MNTLCRCKPLLGTYVEISLSAEETRESLIDMSVAAYAEIEKVHNLMSFHDTESELSYLNRFAYKHPCAVSQETEEVLKQALEISKKTKGIFDVSIAPQLIKQGLLPSNQLEVDETASWKDISISAGKVSFNKKMLLDLGGIAKGYAVDKAISVFDSNINVVVNAGGDIRMSHWQDQFVHIQHPNRKNSSFNEIIMQAPAVATSANYYLDGKNAIISLKNKAPIKDKRSISVFASNCMLADALTKVAFLSNCDPDLMDSFNAQVLVMGNEETDSIH